MPKVLFADDDGELRKLVPEWLEHHQFDVDVAEDGEVCKTYLETSKYDLLVIDWRMPKMSGLDVCRWYRDNEGTTPILMLTGKDDIEDKMVGFSAGVDDYLTKPFEMRELIARLKALLRRGSVAPTRVTSVGPLKMDPDKHRVDVDDKVLKLTGTEFALLECLSKNPNHVFSAGALLGRVWTSSAEVSPDTVRVYIRRLREKLAAVGHPELIQNVHGVGYKLNLPD